MSSGNDWTHHWILTNMSPSNNEINKTQSADTTGNDVFLTGYPIDDNTDEGISTSPVNSIDLERDSPMACTLDDEDEDAGPPSIETQPVEQLEDDMQISHSTSSWINSGGHYGASLHPGLGYDSNNASYMSQNGDREVHLNLENDQNGDREVHLNLANDQLIPLPSGLGGGDRNNEEFLPVFGPSLPLGPCNSPVQENNTLMYGDVADDNASSGLCGLRNLGNTCFMAAGIQCLVNTPPIAQYFFKYHLDNEEDKGTLAGRFSQLIHKMWSGKYSSLRPAEFKEAFGQHWRDFRDYRQHDCQEFMTLLLEALRKQMPMDDIVEANSTFSLQQLDFNREKCSIRESGELSNSPTFNREKCSIRESGELSNSLTFNREKCSIRESGELSNSPTFNREKCSIRESGELSNSPTPPESPQCPLSPSCSNKLQFDTRSDIQEDIVGLDSGTVSPKSSVSSSSVDAHLISLRLQSIPEEVKNFNKKSEINSSNDESSSNKTIGFSCQESESVTSDTSDMLDAMSSTGESVRRYNQLTTTGCDSSYGASSSSHQMTGSYCDSSTGDPKSLNVSPSWQSAFDKNGSFANISSFSPNNHLSMVKIEDIMKETKTSNVNVLAQDNIHNNELFYDSEKYARVETTTKKIKNSFDNLQNKCGLKRVKEVNLLVDKMDNSQIDSSSGINKQNLSSSRINKQIISSAGRNSMVLKRNADKNIVEFERNDLLCDRRLSEATTSTTSSMTKVPEEEQRLSDRSWKSFVSEGNSVVVDTFYGQFKSSLVCCVCGYTSVKFDPFGTLSVPLPHANEIQISVTYVPHEISIPTRCLLTLLKVSTVLDLKNELSKLFGPTKNDVAITEVFDNHIARTVDESYLVKFLNYRYNQRNIYAFELVPPPPIQEEDEDSEKIGNVSMETLTNSSTSSCNTDATAPILPTGSDARWQPCNICLEELCQTDLKTHVGCEDCVLCENCIEMSSKHHGGGSIPCPVCQTQLTPDSFIPVAKRKADKPKARILRVPVVFRVDTESDDNNKREMILTGHPSLLSLPSRIRASTLKDIIERKLAPETPFSLLLVDGRGYNCSRCLFSSHCRGCDALKETLEVHLQAGDTLCVRFTCISPEQKRQLGHVLEHESLLYMRQTEPLTIYDCLRAFSQSETLEENNSWFCPKCECKQQATKTISVWKYPPYLIIHLERFLFHGSLSTKLDDKVIFPLDGLDLSAFVSGHQTSSPLLYNLYSSVCHMGVAQAGHYTALVRSPVTNEWHYFNDDNVTRQKLKEEEFSTSYLLFYYRQGTDFDLALPPNFAFAECPPKQQQESVSSSDDVRLEGCRKRVCLQMEEGDRRAIASSFFLGEERSRKLSSKASDSSLNSSELPFYSAPDSTDSASVDNVSQAQSSELLLSTNQLLSDNNNSSSSRC